MQPIYWIGGSPCAGKTTIADIIAQEHGWRIYHIDRYFESYLERANPNKHPTLSSYKKMGLQNFLSMPAETQLDRVKAISQEQFEFILADVHAIEADTPILVEGANILADDAANQAVDLNHIIWLVPTEDFLLKTYPRRGTWVQDVLKLNFKADERVNIFDNWMRRDALMAKWTANRARELGIQVITIDGSQTIRENTTMVEQHFGLATPSDI